jgi:hypothetical protein
VVVRSLSSYRRFKDGNDTNAADQRVPAPVGGDNPFRNLSYLKEKSDWAVVG